MQVTKITSPIEVKEPSDFRFTQEQLQREFNYMQAEKITKKLLERGFITVDEFDKIMRENQRSFSPYLAEIL